MMSLKDTIKSRRSVRTFDGNPLSREDREKLTEYISSISNPFDIPVEFVLPDAEEYGLSSPVISGNPGIPVPENVEYIASVQIG